MTSLLVWYGELATRRRLALRGLLMLLGAVVWLGVFLVGPLLAMVAVALAQRGPYGDIIWTFSLDNIHRALGYGSYGWSSNHLWILARSVWVALATTLLCILAAYPVAFFVAARPKRSRYLWLTLIMIPLCTNLVIRSYAWMLLLSSQMPPARLAAWLGLIAPDTALYPGSFALYVGMVSSWLPFAILPIYTNVERLDWSLVEAAQDLYASKVQVFLHAIVPQTLPGLMTSLILTFIPAMGSFIVPDLLGGARSWLVGNLIQQQFGQSRNYPLGSAISLGLMALTLAGLLVLRRRGVQGGGL